jgi:photosystem II stability/assembly factor-like uncharacterized protein
MTQAKHKLRVPRATKGAVELLIGTRKGAFRLKSDAARKTWKVTGNWFLGNVVHHLIEDPRRKGYLLCAARTGHLGPTIYRSENAGKTWKEASKPPAFAPAPEGLLQRTVNHTFWLTPGHSEERDSWYAGTSPQGLFRSRDGGRTWKPVKGLNNHPDLDKWTGGDKDGTPDGPKLHSMLVDPRDARHLFIGMSGGGVFESLDTGRSWKPLNQGCAIDFIPGDPEFGHDPHCVGMSLTNPDRLWQQNHCGIYCMDREHGQWDRVGDNMPKKIGDIGFGIVIHPRDPDCVFVFPMDGSGVWPRTSPDGQPAVYRTLDRGQTWKRLDKGFPKEHAYWTVKRQCMAHDGHDPLGVYLGNSGGEVWASVNGGRSWKGIARHLPHVYSVEVAGVRP